MNADRKKFGWPFWTAVALAVPVLYLLTWPVVSWANRRGWLPEGTVRRRAVVAYAYPARVLFQSSSPGMQQRIDWYLRLLGD